MSNKLSDTAFRLIMKSEGGYNPDEAPDVGGASYAGITQQAYDRFRTNKNKNSYPITVKELGGSSVDGTNKYKSPYELQELYPDIRLDIIEEFYEWYFIPFHVTELPEYLQYIHADFAVNAASAANKVIQRMVGIDADGVWGSGTTKAVAEFFHYKDLELNDNPDVDNEMILLYDDLKRQHYTTLAEKNPAKFEKYLKPWLKRSNHVLAELQSYFEDEKPTPSAVEETDDVDIHTIDHPEMVAPVAEEDPKEILRGVIDGLTKLMRKF